MRELYYWPLCDDEGYLGEMDAFFEMKDGVLELAAAWGNNDASWRSEYMNSLLTYLQVKVVELPSDLEDDARALLEKEYGL